jgi:hypothetical protein
MENMIIKTPKIREVRNSKPRKTRNMISDEDIRQRAFEIFRENGGTSQDELDNWFRAEKELRESDQ